MSRTRLLFFVEGFTDIRFVTGLSEISDLTICVPATPFAESGLKARVAASGAPVKITEIEGGRLAFQARSLAWLWRHAPEFDVILSQELLRGSLNATTIGWLRGTPVVTTVALPAREYFRCRRRRGQIGAAAAVAGESVIRLLMTINGRLSTRCVALGTYLADLTRPYCPRTVLGGYYGVDTRTFTPATDDERRELRRKLDLPSDAFLVFLSSRISHEKDPETVLRAVARLRGRGVDARLMNLSGGFTQFLELARTLDLPDADGWVIGRPAAHPMTEVADYFRASDVVAQASLEEGLGLSPLEALACGVPVVATNVGGMSVVLPSFARLTPLQDADAMADALQWIHGNRAEARAQALRGRAMVERDWSRPKVFADLARVLDEVTQSAQRSAA